MTYNLTAMENSTNILQFYTNMNTISGELLTVGLLLVIYIVLFIAFKNYETLTALRTSGFVVSIIAILFWTINLMSLTYMLVPVIVTGLTILLGFIQKE